jgi:hypothetical protein
LTSERDTFYVADKKFFGVWLDDAVDKNSPNDTVVHVGWTSDATIGPLYWGHLYAT